MRLEWKETNIILHLTEDEQEVMNHLVETRGVGTIEAELGHWLMTRLDTIREELKRDIILFLLPDTSIKTLKEKLKELKNG